MVRDLRLSHFITLTLFLLLSRSGVADEPKGVTPQEIQRLKTTLELAQKEARATAERLKNLPRKITLEDDLRIMQDVQAKENFLRAITIKPGSENATSFYFIARQMKKLFEDERSFLENTIEIGNEEWNQRAAVHFFLGRLAKINPEFYEGVIELANLDFAKISQARALLQIRGGEERVRWLRLGKDLERFDALAKIGDKDFAEIEPLKGETTLVFQMGSSDGTDGSLKEEWRYDNETRHRVEITKDFEMGTTEVTQLQWFFVMGNNPSQFRQAENCSDGHLILNGVSLCPNHPVEQVSWDDVQLFLKKLNAMNAGAVYTYRLPTEAEWEYATRGRVNRHSERSEGSLPEVQQGAYTFGNDASLLPEYGWYFQNSSNQTHSVGQKRANSYGLFDMHGNVWEWCQDWYGDYSSADVRNPQGPESGSGRVFRGGSWYDFPLNLRAALRFYSWPDSRSDSLGFRLLRTRNP